MSTSGSGPPTNYAAQAAEADRRNVGAGVPGRSRGPRCRSRGARRRRTGGWRFRRYHGNLGTNRLSRREHRRWTLGDPSKAHVGTRGRRPDRAGFARPTMRATRDRAAASRSTTPADKRSSRVLSTRTATSISPGGINWLSYFRDPPNRMLQTAEKNGAAAYNAGTAWLRDVGSPTVVDPVDGRRRALALGIRDRWVGRAESAARPVRRAAILRHPG